MTVDKELVIIAQFVAVPMRKLTNFIKFSRLCILSNSKEILMKSLMNGNGGRVVAISIILLIQWIRNFLQGPVHGLVPIGRSLGTAKDDRDTFPRFIQGQSVGQFLTVVPIIHKDNLLGGTGGPLGNGILSKETTQ